MVDSVHNREKQRELMTTSGGSGSLYVFEKVVEAAPDGEEDPFEPQQVAAARERLAPFGVDIQWFPGGHLTTLEHPALLADAIRGLARGHGVGQPFRPAQDATGDTTP
jgi:hypothetical protein